MKILAHHPFRSAEAKATYLKYYDESAKNWAIPSETQMVDTSYGQTFVRISGAESAPPLVLFPGAGASSLAWSLNIEALSKNHQTYAVDSLINTGCVGRSIYTRHITSADDAMKWLDELFDGLGLKNNINLLGPSYGGWLASQYALHCPDRLNKVILVAPAGTVLPFRGTYIFRAISLSLLPFRFNYRRFFRWSLPDLAQQNEQFLEMMVDDFSLTARCFVPPNPRELPKLTAMSDEELQSINIPTLVLIGENEKLYHAQEAIQRLHTVAPQIHTEIIPSAGHDLLLVQMDMVNQKIIRFLDQD